MNNREIVKKIEDLKAGTLIPNPQPQEPIYKLLVFHIHQQKLAFYAEQVREILLDVPLFFIPFVPSYIRGFINRHGEPYTVVDMNILFGKKAMDSSTYLILNLEEDQMAFIISDIREILKVPESHIHKITSGEEKESYFRGSVSTEEGEIFILNLASVMDRLAGDLQNAG